MSAPAGKRQSAVAQVERDLAEMWRSAAPKGATVIRACKHNLVVACTDAADDLGQATRMVAKISETEPSRALLIAPVVGSKQEALKDLDVHVSTHCHRGSGDQRICGEQVTFVVGPQGGSLVAGSLLQLVVEEMPVYAWWRRRLDLEDPLLESLRELADRFVVDSARFPSPAEGLAALSSVTKALSWKGTAADLNWLRLDPWREAVASFFDIPALRERLAGITGIEIAAGGPAGSRGRTAAGAYLAGWLASRLDWIPGDKPGAWRRPGGGRVQFTFRHVAGLNAGEIQSVRIDAGEGRTSSGFLAERVGRDSGLVKLSVVGSGAYPLPHVLQLPEADDAAVLCGILQQGTRDALFDAALSDATRLLEE